MVVLAGIVGGIVAALLIAGIGLGIYNLADYVSRKKKHAKQDAWLATFPFEQRKYIDVERRMWHDEETGCIGNMDHLTFAAFTDRVELYGGTIDPGPQIDLTEPDDPFDMDGGFLNADDFEEDTDGIEKH